MEFATIFNNLCSHVTIVEKGRHLMAPMDDVVGERLEEELKRKGISVYCNSTVTEITQENGSLCCTVTPNEEGESITVRGAQVLMAIGRKPDLSGQRAGGLRHRGRGGQDAAGPCGGGSGYICGGAHCGETPQR